MIINLTQHPATNDQIDDGVVDLQGDDLVRLKSLLTFNVSKYGVPNDDDVAQRADAIAQLCKGDKAMIGGIPLLMAPLQLTLQRHGIDPCFAVSDRVSVETTDDDGNVIKKNVFKHLGFYYP